MENIDRKGDIISCQVVAETKLKLVLSAISKENISKLTMYVNYFPKRIIMWFIISNKPHK